MDAFFSFITPKKFFSCFSLNPEKFFDLPEDEFQAHVEKWFKHFKEHLLIEEGYTLDSDTELAYRKELMKVLKDIQAHPEKLPEINIEQTSNSFKWLCELDSLSLEVSKLLTYFQQLESQKRMKQLNTISALNLLTEALSIPKDSEQTVKLRHILEKVSQKKWESRDEDSIDYMDYFSMLYIGLEDILGKDHEAVQSTESFYNYWLLIRNTYNYNPLLPLIKSTYELNGYEHVIQILLAISGCPEDEADILGWKLNYLEGAEAIYEDTNTVSASILSILYLCRMVQDYSRLIGVSAIPKFHSPDVSLCSLIEPIFVSIQTKFQKQEI